MSLRTSFHDKLVDVMKQVGVLGKDGTNSFHKYKYTTVSALQRRVQAALVEQGLHLETGMELLHKGDGDAVVKVSIAISDGVDKVVLEGIGEGSDKGDKSVPKAISNAVKYAWATGLCVAWVELDDPEKDSSTDSDANTVDSLTKAFLSAKTTTDLDVLVAEVQKLINDRKVTPGQSKKLAQKYKEAQERIST